ncbi:MAG: hypothetical protein EBQ92_07835 [Proteobacteria bacterium]|nr:hypothetical protein [Pseudomonadota bacterium]
MGFVCLLVGKSLFQNQLQITDALRGPDAEETKVSYRGESLKKLTFGYDSFLASLLWIRLLQEAKYTPIKSNSVSWEFSEVDAVTTLDPNFDPAYNFGSLYVSFFRRDKVGGQRILEKWVKHAPTFWKPHHMLGMHYFLELGDYTHAAPHIIRASQLPDAPPYIASLGVGLLGQAGASFFVLQSACELFEAATGREARIRLARRVRGLRWHLEKQSWENALMAFKKKQGGALPRSLADLTRFLKTEPARDISSVIPHLKQSEPLQILFSEKFQFALSKDRKTIEALNPAQAQEFENIGVYLQKESP